MHYDFRVVRGARFCLKLQCMGIGLLTGAVHPDLPTSPQIVNRRHELTHPSLSFQSLIAPIGVETPRRMASSGSASGARSMKRAPTSRCFSAFCSC